MICVSGSCDLDFDSNFKFQYSQITAEYVSASRRFVYFERLRLVKVTHFRLHTGAFVNLVLLTSLLT